jgi:hypothetical protein
MRLEALAAVTIKITVSWNMIPCSLVDIYKHSAGTACLNLFIHTEVEDSRALQNTRKYRTDYMASYT